MTALPYYLKTPHVYISVTLTNGEVPWWELVSCLPSAESEWIQQDTQNIRLQWTQAESLHIVFTVCTTSKQLMCATRISHLILYKNNVCVKYCIWVMPGSNLDRDIDYPKYFSWTFSAPLQANSGISTYNEVVFTSFYILYNSLSPYVHLRAILYIFSGLHSHEI